MDYVQGNFSASCLDNVWPMGANTVVIINLHDPVSDESLLEKIIYRAVDHINNYLKDSKSDIQIAVDECVKCKVARDGKLFKSVKFEVHRA